jgi:pyruvate formate lyase activating enzyme
VTTGLIFDIKRFAVHDGPGLRTTVFLKGCPLSCWSCHNPEGQSTDREVFVRPERCDVCADCLELCRLGAISLDGDSVVVARDRCDRCGSCVDVCLPGALEMTGREVTVAEVMGEIDRDVLYYDESGGGATFSGGEPLAQPLFLERLLVECRKRQISTAVDTSGHAPASLFDSIRPIVDLFLYDIKLIDEERHQAFTGASNKPILENLRMLAEWGATVVIRFPLLTGINDDSTNVEQLARFLVALPTRYSVDILPYHRIGQDKYLRLGREYRMQDTCPPADEDVYKTAQLLADFGLEVAVRGEPYAPE